MADLEARREARRRKILQNSENRLKSITSIEKKSDIQIDGLRNLPYPEEKNEILSELNNYTTSPKINHLHGSNSAEKIESPSISKTNSFLVTKKQILTNQKAILIAIAILACYSIHIRRYIFGDGEYLKFSYLNMVFLPLLAYEIIDFIFCPYNFLVNFSFIQMFVRHAYASFLLKLLGFIYKFMQDLTLYFFIFVIFDYILSTWTYLNLGKYFFL